MRLLIAVCVMWIGLATSNADSSQRLQKMEQIMKDLTKQLVTQQFYVEERIRSDGDSGELKSFTLVSLIVTMHEYKLESLILVCFALQMEHANLFYLFLFNTYKCKTVGILILIMKSKYYIYLTAIFGIFITYILF